MSEPEPDICFRERIAKAAHEHHEKHQRAAFGGASLSDLGILIAEAAGIHLDEVGKHYGVTRSSSPQDEAESER